MPELICKILHIGKTTYYKYLKEGYPIITFLLSFDKKELEELLKTGKIQNLEICKNLKDTIVSTIIRTITQDIKHTCLNNTYIILRQMQKQKRYFQIFLDQYHNKYFNNISNTIPFVPFGNLYDELVIYMLSNKLDSSILELQKEKNDDKKFLDELITQQVLNVFSRYSNEEIYYYFVIHLNCKPFNLASE